MGPAYPLSIDAEVRNGIKRVSLRGEIDLSTVDLLDGQLLRQDGVASEEMLDLRDVSFMDSTGLHALLRARALGERDGRRVVVLGVSPAVRRVFELSGVGRLLDFDAVDLLDRFTSGATSNGRAHSSDEVSA